MYLLNSARWLKVKWVRLLQVIKPGSSSVSQVNLVMRWFIVLLTSNFTFGSSDYTLSVPSTVLGMQPSLPPETVRELVCSCLHRDPVAADLRCSLFVAAAENYKRDSLLRPFPPRYISGDSKDFEELVRVCDSQYIYMLIPHLHCTVKKQTLGGSNVLLNIAGCQ